MMIVGIGSTNDAKVNACKKAFDIIRRKFPEVIDSNLEFIPLIAETTVPDMPLSLEQILKGAAERAHFVYDSLKKQKRSVDYSIGMEGGTYRLDLSQNSGHQAILQSWVYIFNGVEGHFGCSPGLPLPASIEVQLYEKNRELSEIIDEVSGKEDVRSKEGAFGILTNNLFTRTGAFEAALISAMIPFINTKFYK
ncbi:MAG: DUF84 family protein [Calditrichaceae bacterium]